MAESVGRPLFQSGVGSVCFQELAEVRRTNITRPSDVRFKPGGKIVLDLHEAPTCSL